MFGLLTIKVLLDSADPENCVQEFLAEIRGVGQTGWVNIHTDKIYETEQVSKERVGREADGSLPFP